MYSINPISTFLTLNKLMPASSDCLRNRDLNPVECLARKGTEKFSVPNWYVAYPPVVLIPFNRFLSFQLASLYPSIAIFKGREV